MNKSIRQISDKDGRRMDLAVQLAIALREKRAFEDAIVAACEHLGWEANHSMTLWTVAVYCDRFPYVFFRCGDQSVRFAQPEAVFKICNDPIFWEDKPLVELARRRMNDVNRPRNANGTAYSGA